MNSIEEIYDHLMTSLQESILESFSEITRNSDRVKFVTDLLRQKELLPTSSDKILKSKSLNECRQLKNDGNRAFIKKDDKKALVLYTKSIAAAPIPTDSPNNEANDALGIAFANRSAVLFSMRNYEKCLQDISQALKYNYPDKFLFKIYERQGRCFQNLGKRKEAVESINNALKSLSSAELTQEKRKRLERELQILLNCFQGSRMSTNPVKEPQIITMSCNQNDALPGASDCVEVKYFPGMGRGLSAARDIQPGEVLIVEKPYASHLFLKKFDTHCYNCLQRSEAMLPCFYCSNVMFCSEECRTASWNKNHFIDCGLLPTLEKLDITIGSFVALRIVIMVCKTRDMKELLASLKIEENLGKRNETQLFSSDYYHVYWLEGHAQDRSNIDVFRRSFQSAYILHCLETMSDFFSGIDVNEYKYEVGGLLLQHRQNLPCTLHQVSEMMDITSRWEDVGIGSALCSVASLMNHSCDQNAICTSHMGDTLVVRAITPIAAGQQIFDTYGSHYSMHMKAQRQLNLRSQYYFSCQCVPCSENWPPLGLLGIRSQATFICNKCKEVLPAHAWKRTIKCGNCKKWHNIVETRTKIEKSSTEFYRYILQIERREDGTNWHELAQKLIQHLMIFHENVKKPWSDYIDCQEAIAECFRMTGNCYKSGSPSED
ncbi:hypothetical protein L9F63_001501 [Diploptera punctata]|uniref:Protein-lysine N-methyltransferase SMYD4 n=1 Tax=Diploptera punctata TaxID=6984 RepID=A0AAD8EJ97_DIPPU|nr:hypothetical protein L9F63_001501 [Diploptera punctata]